MALSTQDLLIMREDYERELAIIAADVVAYRRKGHTTMVGMLLDTYKVYKRKLNQVNKQLGQ